jgi:hypothetical protein
MGKRDAWYGNNGNSHTVLLLAELRPGKSPAFVVPHFGEDAYAHYMLAAYTRELVMVQTNPEYLCWSPGFRTFADAVAALSEHRRVAFEEVGSTLFSTIDKMDKAHPETASRIDYRGVEVIKDLCDTAKRFHPSHSLEHYGLWTDLPDADCIVSRSYQAQSYAMTSTEELAGWMGRSVLSQQGIWFAVGDEQTTEIMGKRVTLFDFAELSARLSVAGMKLAVLKAERFQFRDVEFVSAWLIAFRPDAINEGDLLAQLALEVGEVTNHLSPTNEVKPHAGAFDAGGNIAHRLDPTFNFGGPEMEAAFGKYAGG